MTQLVPESWSVPASLRARVGAVVGRQRAIVEQGHALLLLHQVPASGERVRRPLVIWRGPDATWTSLAPPRGVLALRALLDAYDARLEALDGRRARSTDAKSCGALLAEARPVERALRHAHLALQSLRDAVPDDTDVLQARDRAYELSRTAELLLEDVAAALEVTVAERAEEQAALAERIAIESRRLNLLAAVCLPITALGSILGMNLPHGLEGTAGPGTFWAIVLAATAMGVALTAWIQRLPPRVSDARVDRAPEAASRPARAAPPRPARA